jgi:hypothetical protein
MGVARQLGEHVGALVVARKKFSTADLERQPDATASLQTVLRAATDPARVGHRREVRLYQI